MQLANSPVTSGQEPRLSASGGGPGSGGGLPNWKPTLNNGVDGSGAPVYDNTSVRRLNDRHPGLAKLQNRADFSSVQAGVRGPVMRSMVSGDVLGGASQTGASGPPQAQLQLPKAPVVARPSTAPQVQGANVRALDGQRRATLQARGDAASMLNPMSDAGELMRRFHNSQRSYQNKGSPQARRMAGEAILSQLGAMNAASGEGQAAAGRALEAGAQDTARASEAHARRRQEVDTFNAEDSYRHRAPASEDAARRNQLDRPTLETDADGNLLQITGTRVQPVTGSDGAPVRKQVAAARNLQSDADDRLLADLLGLQKDQFGEYPADALGTARQQLAEIRGGQRAGQSAASSPRQGEMVDGYQFMGGDPSSPANWERPR